MRTLAAAGAAAVGLVSGAAGTLLHQQWWGLALALVAGLAVLAWLPPGGVRLAFAVGWCLAVVRGALERPAGGFLIASDVAGYRAELHAQRARLSLGSRASGHAKKSYELTTARLQEAQGLPIEALASIQTLAEARQAEVDAVIDYNIAQHRLFAALGTPR